MPTRLIYAIVFVIIFTFIMNRKAKRQRESAWQGAITGIRHQRAAVERDEDRKDDDWVTIRYRTDEGRDRNFKVRMRVFRQYFGGVQCGDRLVKVSGSYLPKREVAAVPELHGESA